MASNTSPTCFWQPQKSVKTCVDEFREEVNRIYNLRLSSYSELYSWSVENYADFWKEVWEYSNVTYSQKYDKVVDESKTIADIPEWFPGSRLNYAENVLKSKELDKIAVISAVEGQEEVKNTTLRQLKQRVAQYSAAMKQMGVKAGDRVVGYIPNCTEAIEAMLAASSIGAIWSSTSPDYGVSGVLDRFTQIKPKLLFTINAVVYNGKVHNHIEKLEAVVQGIPDLELVVIIPYVKASEKSSNVDRSCSLDDFLSKGLTADGSVPGLVFEQLPFNHPLFIMYSSGTTGPPKCIVHSAGGTLMKHLEEHLLQGNTQPTDVMLYYTTTGWMMWNWLVSSLAVGCSVVCYDGSPLVPSANVLWDLIDKLGITILGTGAKWLSVLEERGIKPKFSHSLSTLHTIVSTGSPLKPDSFEFVYRDIKQDLLLASISGGTDIIGSFVGHSWAVPVYKGEIQCRYLGMAVESWNEAGDPVFDESGELVCTKPFPSMPVSFWNDPDGEKYKAAYFAKYPGVWTHGDFCLISSTTGGILMLGRSDGTLNPNGVRFGSAEIYHVTEAFKEIEDSLCVAQRNKDASEERVVLFLKMAPGEKFNEDIVKKVRGNIRSQLSARHVPAVMLEIKDIPYTISGKKVEVAVKKIITGEEVKSRGSFSNPDSLDFFKNIPELQEF